MVSRRDNETSSQTRNYEVNKTREVYEKTQGEIEKLTASVLINYKQNLQVNEEGEETIVAEPYTEEEIAEFGSVVRTALGMSEERGDELTITQISSTIPTAVDSYGILQRTANSVEPNFPLGADSCNIPDHCGTDYEH